MASIKDGVWRFIPSVNSGKNVIGPEGDDDAFGDEWRQVLSYDGFNFVFIYKFHSFFYLLLL